MKSKNTFVGSADAQKEQQRAEYAKLVDEIRERNRKREQEATFTEIWYTFVDPYATDVDERGSGNELVRFINRNQNENCSFQDDAHKAVGVLTVKNGKRIIGKRKTNKISLSLSL